MKYIVFNLGDTELLFTFPRCIDHDRMMEACRAIRFGDTRNWDRKLHPNREDGTPISAGFIDNGKCHGRSETLGISSRPKEDTKLFQEQLQC